MSFNINTNFSVGVAQPIDSRLLLSKNEMLRMRDNIMPQVYFALCKDDGKLYIYNKRNESDTTTGKFRLFGNEQDMPNTNIIFSTYSDFPTVGESNVLYIAEDKDVIYRWNDNKHDYVALNEPNIEVIQVIL